MNQINQTRTREEIEYEEALKHLHDLHLKASLSVEGIDTSLISKQKFDEIKRLLDKQGKIKQKAQEKMNVIQTEMQKEINEVQTEITGIVTSLKEEQGITGVAQQDARQPETEKAAED